MEEREGKGRKEGLRNGEEGGEREKQKGKKDKENRKGEGVEK